MNIGLGETWDQVDVEVDRRNSARLPGADGTHLWLDNDVRIAVQVLNVSDKGLGISLPDMSFVIGPTVTVDFEGERRQATVAWLQREGDSDAFRMGLEWKHDA